MFRVVILYDPSHLQNQDAKLDCAGLAREKGEGLRHRNLTNR